MIDDPKQNDTFQVFFCVHVHKFQIKWSNKGVSNLFGTKCKI